ncbi:MAG: DNA double-strand break repair nuclease NurA [Anaerolineales bacterium]|jgi:hypothetical protein
MALNFQQVFEKIREIGLGAHARQERLEGLRKQARERLEAWADKNAELLDKLERARQADPSVRCAIPLDERMDAAFPATADLKSVSLLAADGSQILPDRHAAVQYSLVNVGAIAMRSGSGDAPGVFTDSQLLFGEELFSETGLVTGEAIEQRRDIAERRKLLELAPDYPAPVIALTDGPVELWGAKGAGEDDYRKNLEIHKSILIQLQAKGVSVAGYVDKPGADLVVRTLEIAQLSTEEEFKELRKLHSLRGVTDRWLYRFLPGGQRSAVFGLQSSSRAHYTGELALHFFYLNVGDTQHPWLVRVEIPKWVAEEVESLNRLQAALLEQCSMMGAKPYPYILQRAHEIAVVKFEEKAQVEQMLEMEMRQSGSEMDEISAKQSAKNLKGRSG